MRTSSPKCDARLPAEHAACLRRIAANALDIGRAKQDRIADDVLGPIEPQVRKDRLAELADRMRLAGGDHVVVGAVLLQHEPHGFHVVAGKAPIAADVDVAQAQPLVPPELDAGRGRGDLARDEVLGPAGRLVVEQDAAAGEQAERLPVIDRLQMRKDLGAGVGTARMEGTGFRLGQGACRTEHLARRRLVEADFAPGPVAMPTDRLQHAHRADAVCQGERDRFVKRCAHAAQTGEIVDFVRPHLVQDSAQIARRCRRPRNTAACKVPAKPVCRAARCRAPRSPWIATRWTGNNHPVRRFR